MKSETVPRATSKFSSQWTRKSRNSNAASLAKHFHAGTLQVCVVHSPVSPQAHARLSKLHLQNTANTRAVPCRGEDWRGGTEPTATTSWGVQWGACVRLESQMCLTVPEKLHKLKGEPERKASQHVAVSCWWMLLKCHGWVRSDPFQLQLVGRAQLTAWSELFCSVQGSSSLSCAGGWLGSASHTSSRSPSAGKVQKRKKSRS